jgi:Zn-dependent protease with chaperone function
MSFSYSVRLVCLCLASFFLVHSVLAALTYAMAPAAGRIAHRLRPRNASRLLFVVRIFPFAVSLLIVLSFCIPSYLWLEPEAETEKVGRACLLAAAAGALLFAASLMRATRALARSMRYLRSCRLAGQEQPLDGHSRPVLVLESDRPIMALSGIFRPQVLVSRGILRTLSRAQLEAAIGHEAAHKKSRDNLKHLLVLLAPGIVPGIGGFAALERAWFRFTECAADDEAVQGDSRRALSLAEALVRVAQMGLTPPAPALAGPLMSDEYELPLRVERLLRMEPFQPSLPQKHFPTAASLLALCLGAAAVFPTILSAVHNALEQLVR